MEKRYLVFAVLLFVLQVFGQNQSSNSNQKFKKESKIQFSAGYGYGWLTGNIQKTGLGPLIDGPISSMSSGGVFNANLYFNVSSNIAIGLKYDRYSSSGSSSVISTRYKTIFIGPSLLVSGQDSRIGHLSTELALGYLGNEQSFSVLTSEFNESLSLEGSTFGFFAGMAYHFRVTDQFSIGPEVKVILGKLTRGTQTENGRQTTVELDEGLSRIDLGVTAKLRF
ncbi:MAG: autotransporter domain-containing protein [Limnohabitans sp.]|nr:autotransporter domain-containing protein [Limnohabitans sp.]